MPLHDDSQPYFSYSPLSGKIFSIRLCKILKGQANDPIFSELTETALDSNSSPYYALSYEWGPRGTRWIHVNNTRFTVRPNLLAALRAIRRPDEDIVVWIDAICINQLDTAEKSHQVGRMGHIFSTAKEVLVWLGKESHDSDLVFEYVNTQDTAVTEALTEALKSLGKRSYWTRLWVRQEFILAKELRIFCGRKSAPWNVLAPALTYHQEGPGSYNEPFLEFEFETPAQSIIAEREKHWNHQPLPLFKLLLHSTWVGCSDLRDKVFGILAIASDCHQHQHEMVDYSLDKGVLFLGIRQFYLGSQDTATLNMLLARTFQLNIHNFFQPATFIDWYRCQFGLRQGTEDNATQSDLSQSNGYLTSGSFFYEKARLMATRILDIYQDPEFQDLSTSSSLGPGFCCLELGSSRSANGSDELVHISRVGDIDVHLTLRFSGFFFLLDRVSRSDSTGDPALDREPEAQIDPDTTIEQHLEYGLYIATTSGPPWISDPFRDPRFPSTLSAALRRGQKIRPSNVTLIRTLEEVIRRHRICLYGYLYLLQVLEVSFIPEMKW